MKGATHTHFWRGKRVFVRLTDGDRFVDHFVESSRDAILFRRRGKVRIRHIKTIGIAKGDGLSRT